MSTESCTGAGSGGTNRGLPRFNTPSGTVTIACSQPVRRFPGDKWLDVAMIRMNNKGVKMDSMDTRDTDKLGDVKEVVEHVKQVRSQGIGVISMKLVGEGRFTQREQRQAALKFAMNVAGVDAVTIGYKNTREIDEAIENMNLAFA